MGGTNTHRIKLIPCHGSKLSYNTLSCKQFNCLCSFYIFYSGFKNDMAMANKIYIKLIKWANKQIFIERNIEQAKDILYLFI